MGWQIKTLCFVNFLCLMFKSFSIGEQIFDVFYVYPVANLFCLYLLRFLG